MRVLVCGGRDYRNYPSLVARLSTLEIDVLIHGAARGADTLADTYARSRNIPVLRFPVTSEDWTLIGKRAGPLRNARMLAEGLPDLVVAFPGGNGTADMVKQARGAGIRVWEIV